jgi:energy-coupling factor transporter ATP-binding protein EcfA2
MTEGQGASAVPVPAGGSGDSAVPIPAPAGATVPAGDAPTSGGSRPGQGRGGAHDGPVRAGGSQPGGAHAGSAEPGGAHAGGAHAGAAQPAGGGSHPTGAHTAGARTGGAHAGSEHAGGAHAGGAHAGGAHAGGARASGGRGDGPRSAAGRAGAPDPGTPGEPGAWAAGPGAASAQTPRGGSSGAEPSDAEAAGAEAAGIAGAAGAGGEEMTAPTEPYVKVDARRLEAALLSLRHLIVTVPLVLEAPGVAEARAERRKLLSQIDDYLLPRLRQSGAPILVALVGSTGAGKSTLMNSLVGIQVSQTGIRRPTTNSPVLACHPADAHWFAENVFLPTLPRVRQQGLAMPGRDGLLVLAASEGMPRGVALLDTPDIDSVVKAHRDFAHQFLDASDQWLFMTSARRYADAAVWELLQDARDRSAALAVVLSRVPPSAAVQLGEHFDAMLEANGLTGLRRFLIAETIVTGSMLPTEIARPVLEWLQEIGEGDDRRVAVLTQTMSGMLDTFRTRVPALAEQAETQLTLRQELREAVRAAYDDGLAEIDTAASSGSLLRGEVLARWQDFAGTGDLMRTLQVRRGRGSGKAKKKRLPARAGALRAALRTSLESLVAATGARAAEAAVARCQDLPAGAALLSQLAAAAEAGRSEESDYLTRALADLGIADRAADDDAAPVDAVALARPSAELTAAARKLVRAWQERVLQLVQAENVTKRSIARVVSFDHEPLALVLMIGALGSLGSGSPGSAGPATAAGSVAPGGDQDDVTEGAGAASTAGAAGASGTAPAGAEPMAGPEQLLGSLFGAGQLRELTTRARQDLHDRVAAAFEVELARFSEVIDAAGVPDEKAGSQLMAASEALEAAR